ncbi:MAG: hypothetical protein ACFCUQ_22690 [Kiloniellales bacterium]
MAVCDNCGNDYDKAFQVKLGGKSYTFDSFECAIQSVAPRCGQCGTPIVGHGLESGGSFYCCAHCAKQNGQASLQDRA